MSTSTESAAAAGDPAADVAALPDAQPALIPAVPPKYSPASAWALDDLPPDEVLVGPAPVRELVESIKMFGVMEPVLVTTSPLDGAISVISGRRRIKACRYLGLKRIPVRTVELEEGPVPLAMTLTAHATRQENVSADLDAILGLALDGRTEKEIAQATGYRLGTIRARLRLKHDLHPDLFEGLRQGRILLSVAEQAMKLARPLQDRLALYFAETGQLSASDVDRLRRANEAPQLPLDTPDLAVPDAPDGLDPAMDRVQQALTAHDGLGGVAISIVRELPDKLVLHFDNDHSLVVFLSWEERLPGQRVHMEPFEGQTFIGDGVCSSCGAADGEPCIGLLRTVERLDGSLYVTQPSSLGSAEMASVALGEHPEPLVVANGAVLVDDEREALAALEASEDAVLPEAETARSLADESVVDDEPLPGSSVVDVDERIQAERRAAAGVEWEETSPSSHAYVPKDEAAPAVSESAAAAPETAEPTDEVTARRRRRSVRKHAETPDDASDAPVDAS